jgi:hypothetical protein
MASIAVAEDRPNTIAKTSSERVVYRVRHTLASRFVFLTICIAIVVSALAFGTVHYWALAIFNLGALCILILWVIDGWDLRTFRISRNLLQLPLIGMLILGFIQLLPLRSMGALGLTTGVVQTLSLDANSTRLALVQISTLLIYFSATLVFIDTPHRLKVLVRTILIFGFCPGDFRFDSVDSHPDESLLDSRVNPKHRFWAIHQQASFRWIHGVDHRFATRSSLRRGRP